MVDVGEWPANGRGSTRWTVDEVLAAVAQAGENAAAIASAVSVWAAQPDLRITGGTGRTYPSFTVLADTMCATGAGFRGILSLYADSHGSGPALEVRVNEMCNTAPYDDQQACDRLTADLHSLGIPRLDREDVLCNKRPEIPLAELSHGRAERLLALIDRWIGEVGGRSERRVDMPGRQRVDLDIAQLTKFLEDDQACRDLRLYFGAGLGPGELPSFTGGRFELLGGGGDRADTCNRFTASDILSVEMLSVRLPPLVALDLLEGALGEEAAALLEQIPISIPLWDARAVELIGDDGPADGLWRLLESQEGVGWVTAGKLLARKRPSLIPVYDDVVRCAFGRPKDIWKALHNALRQDDGSFLTVLQNLMRRAGIPAEVTPLRALDVTLWMRHRPFHTGHGCGGLT